MLLVQRLDSGFGPLWTHFWISFTDLVIVNRFEDFGTVPRHMDHGSQTFVIGNHFEGFGTVPGFILSGARTRFTEFYWDYFFIFPSKFLVQN